MVAKKHCASIAALLTVLLIFPVGVFPQTPPPTSEAPSPALRTGAGVTTGDAQQYAVCRTVGIVDPKAPMIFEDVTAKTALANFKHVTDDPDVNYIIDTPSGGLALLDYDNDGLLDVYLINGMTMKAMRGEEKAPRAALFRNLGNFKFEDVTDKAGVANERWGMGVAVRDYDNDGFADMFVSNYGVSRLYHNNGNGTFRMDVAEKLGVARKGWSTGATWGDYDNDGRLDLFVPAYVDFDLNRCHEPGRSHQIRWRRSKLLQLSWCDRDGGPRGLKGEKDTLYHQKADGTFEDASAKSGVNDPLGYYGFSSAFVRLRDSNLLDLLVVSDSTAKQLYAYINQEMVRSRKPDLSPASH